MRSFYLRLARLLAVAAALGSCAIAFAQDAAASLPSDALDLVGFIVQSFKSGDKTLGVAALLTLVVYIVRRTVLPNLPAAALPWVSAVAGVIAAVATNLVAHEPWLGAILKGLLAGAAASGLYSLIGKAVLAPKPDPAAIK
jgi:hypothetical protein